MIIDGHSHVILPADQHIKMMDEAGVGKTILFSTSIHPEVFVTFQDVKKEMQKLNQIIEGGYNASQKEKFLNFEEQKSIIQAYPERFLGFGSIPFAMMENEDKLHEYIQENIVKIGFRGMGEFTLPTGQIKKMEMIFRSSTYFDNLPLWIHGFFPLEAEDIKTIAIFAKKYSKVPIIIGHLGGVNWMQSIELAKEIPNLYLDTSACFSTFILGLAINEIPEKCIFGVDLPYGDIQLSIETIRKYAKYPSVAKLVLGDNISTILNL